MSSKSVPWKSQRMGFEESLVYMKGRKKGTIKSLLTPWDKFNDAGIGGIEWNTITMIAARSAGGKTVTESQIVREAFELNPGEDFNILRFQLEMLARTSAIREYSSVIGKSYKYLCSAEGELSDEDLQKCWDYAKGAVKYPIDLIEEPVTVNEFVEIIDLYMEEHAVRDAAGKILNYRKLLVTFDHSILLMKSAFEKDKMEMLYNFGAALTRLKKKYPISFIILSQLNRDILKQERCEDGKQGNYISESDIFGADALFFHADIVVAIDRPALRNIRLYGPDRYIIDRKDILVFHFLKCRNGDPRISFFRSDFERMSIVEMPPPPQQERKMRTS